MGLKVQDFRSIFLIQTSLIYRLIKLNLYLCSRTLRLGQPVRI